MSLKEKILEFTTVYQLWQAPFADQKFRPVIMNNDLRKVRRVLDVACGPGTNTKYFAQSDYLGIDLNERYIQTARQKYGRDFQIADARSYSVDETNLYDFILINSFLHHINTAEVQALLANLRKLLSADGHIHILELVLPETKSIARTLAHWDRGKFARPVEEWKTIFSEFFKTEVFEPYPLRGGGTALWNMVYFKGCGR